jgi:hypothetical protein
MEEEKGKPDDAAENAERLADPDYQESTSGDETGSDEAGSLQATRTGFRNALASASAQGSNASTSSSSADAAAPAKVKPEPVDGAAPWVPDQGFFKALQEHKRAGPRPDAEPFIPDQPSVIPSCDFKNGIYDKKAWTATLSSHGSTVDMVLKGRGKASRQTAYSIPIKRVNKALRTLHPMHITLSLTKPCGCSKACNTLFSYHDLAAKRQWYLSFGSELESRSGLVQDLLPFYDKKTRRLHYHIQDKGVDVAVCSSFYSQAIGVGETKMVRVRLAVRAGNVRFIHGNQHKYYQTEAQKASRTRAFWREYYPIICQVVQDRNVVLPEGTIIGDIYRMTFVPWWEDRGFCDKEGSAIKPPSLRTFGKEGHHPDFGHVKYRAKHTHLRCSTCASLRAASRLGFRDGEDVDKYVAAFRAHQHDVKEWHATENYWRTSSSNNPHKYITVLGDDTSALGFPHLTNRDYKTVASKHRVKFVPWLFHNFASDMQTYIYSLKNKYKKVSELFVSVLIHARDFQGGNRFCTMMTAILRAIKERSGPQSTAETFVFIGDNYVENKCNTDLAWANVLVSEGWFKEIQFLYGPRGHTHNGIDAYHNFHNTNVGGRSAGIVSFLSLPSRVLCTNYLFCIYRDPGAVLRHVQACLEEEGSVCRPLRHPARLRRPLCGRDHQDRRSVEDRVRPRHSPSVSHSPRQNWVR